MDVLHVDGTGEEGSDFSWREACDAAADAGYEEGHFRMLNGKLDEILHVWHDGFHAALHGGNGVALSCNPTP